MLVRHMSQYRIYNAKKCIDISKGFSRHCGLIGICTNNFVNSLVFDVQFYRAMTCIRGTSHGPVSVRPSQVGVLLKRLNESSWFLARELPSTRPTLC